MTELSLLAWAALALGAVTVGISKTAFPGANIAVVLFAMVLPARESTAALLLLLILADLFALAFYRRNAEWRLLRYLAPPVLVGLALGSVFLAHASDQTVGRVIGAILISVITLGLFQRRRAERKDAHQAAESTPDAASSTASPDETTGSPDETSPPSRRASSLAQGALYGTLGGFTTMVANSAGPVMSMYFIAARLPVAAFLGTSAWFYFAVNVSKLPFSIGLGLFSAPMLLMDLILAPFVILGAFLGRWIISRINKRVFEWAIIVLSIIGAIYLIAG